MVEVQHFLYSEGDINTTRLRQLWMQNVHDEPTIELLQRDANVFLHQALSSPCMDVLKSAEGSYIENMAGHCYLDFMVIMCINWVMGILELSRRSLNKCINCHFHLVDLPMKQL